MQSYDWARPRAIKLPGFPGGPLRLITRRSERRGATPGSHLATGATADKTIRRDRAARRTIASSTGTADIDYFICMARPLCIHSRPRNGAGSARADDRSGCGERPIGAPERCARTFRVRPEAHPLVREAGAGNDLADVAAAVPNSTRLKTRQQIRTGRGCGFVAPRRSRRSPPSERRRRKPSAGLFGLGAETVATFNRPRLARLSSQTFGSRLSVQDRVILHQA